MREDRLNAPPFHRGHFLVEIGGETAFHSSYTIALIELRKGVDVPLDGGMRIIKGVS